MHSAYRGKPDCGVGEGEGENQLCFVAEAVNRGLAPSRLLPNVFKCFQMILLGWGLGGEEGVEEEDNTVLIVYMYI